MCVCGENDMYKHDINYYITHIRIAIYRSLYTKQQVIPAMNYVCAHSLRLFRAQGVGLLCCLIYIFIHIYMLRIWLCVVRVIPPGGDGTYRAGFSYAQLFGSIKHWHTHTQRPEICACVGCVAIAERKKKRGWGSASPVFCSLHIGGVRFLECQQ